MRWDLPIVILMTGLQETAESLIDEALGGEADLALVTFDGGGIDLLLALRQTGARVLAIPLEQGEFPGICSHVLAEYPDMALLGISSDAEYATVAGLGLNVLDVHRRPWQRLANAIRDAVKRVDASS